MFPLFTLLISLHLNGLVWWPSDGVNFKMGYLDQNKNQAALNEAMRIQNKSFTMPVNTWVWGEERFIDPTSE